MTKIVIQMPEDAVKRMMADKGKFIKEMKEAGFDIIDVTLTIPQDENIIEENIH
jgi:hypothetical protein